MADKTGFYIKAMTIDAKGLLAKSRKELRAAMVKGAIQLIDWTANGSPVNEKRPPIRWGILSGSGSAFVGGQFITTTESAGKGGTPNRQLHNTDATGKIKITIGYNTEYAAAVHEGLTRSGDEMKPGPYSRQAGPTRYPGNKWLSSHLQTDGPLLLKVVAEFLKSNL